MRPVAAHAWLATVLMGLASCSSENPDALVAREAGPQGSGGSGGAIVDAPSDVPSDAAFESGAQDAPADLDLPVEDAGGQPDGPSVFTFVHGIVDARHLRVCFHARDANGFSPVDAAPLPADAAGLAYAHAFAASSLPGGIDLATTDVRPIVYTGNLDNIADLSCSQISPPPAGIIATPLAVVPAGSLARQRSVLFVAAGCIGGAGHDDSASDVVCGAGYSSTNPNATLLVASMDRVTDSGSLGIQGFGGSLASAAVTVDLGIAEPASTFRLVSKVPLGVVAPTPPATELTDEGLGLTPSDNTLRFVEEGQVDPSAERSLADALSRGGASIDSFAEGSNFTIVWVGPKSAVAAGPWWQEFTAVVLPSAPAP